MPGGDRSDFATPINKQHWGDPKSNLNGRTSDFDTFNIGTFANFADG